MADQASDFMRDYQTLAQQSWDAWTRQLQPYQAANTAPVNPFFKPPPAAGSEALERTLTGLKGYFDWMQGAATAANVGDGVDWNRQLQQWLGGASQPFAQVMGGIDSVGAESFAKQWQSWLQAAGKTGFGEMPGAQGGPTPSFGLNREQQMQQQAFAAAMFESMQAAGRYQALLLKANAQAMGRLQDKLAAHAEPGRQIESLKGLYDVWVDAAEEAYAEIALSDEFRQVYGEMVNTQMKARQMQQQQIEQICRELGVPTRAEVSSIGKRLQELRREMRAFSAGGEGDSREDLQKMRRELDALKQQLADRNSAGTTRAAARKTGSSAPSAGKSMAAKKTARKAVSAKKPASAKKASSTKKTASTSKATKATKSAPRGKTSAATSKGTSARGTSRKRK